MSSRYGDYKEVKERRVKSVKDEDTDKKEDSYEQEVLGLSGTAESTKPSPEELRQMGKGSQYEKEISELSSSQQGRRTAQPRKVQEQKKEKGAMSYQKEIDGLSRVQWNAKDMTRNRDDYGDMEPGTAVPAIVPARLEEHPTNVSAISMNSDVENQFVQATAVSVQSSIAEERAMDHFVVSPEGYHHQQNMVHGAVQHQQQFIEERLQDQDDDGFSKRDCVVLGVCLSFVVITFAGGITVGALIASDVI